MTQDHIQAANGRASSFPAQLAQAGQQRMTALIDMQREVLDTFEQLNREWLARAQSEASLACDLVGKMGSAHAAAAYQEWINRRGEMLAQDARALIAGGEKLAGVYARFFLNRSAAGSS
jgi:hypothetical protein